MRGTKYLLSDLVGTGGMGMVHRAVADGQSEPLAIKQLRPELASDPAMVVRFEAEMRIGQLLSHPCIPRVLDDGTTPTGAPFFVMGWCDGDPLGVRIAGLGLPSIEEAIEITRIALGALAHAHERGIVHGDIKGDNILVAGGPDAWRVWLIDWGLARKLDEPSSSSTEFVSGTPGYMAPEILRGSAPTIAADVYGIGAVLYELLTGVSPFGTGTAAEVFQRQIAGEVQPPSQRAPERAIPAYLDRAVMRALAHAPCDRFPSARDLADALVDGEPRFADGSVPIPRVITSEFSTTEPTRDWKPHALPPGRLAAGTGPLDAIAPPDEQTIASDALGRASRHLASHGLVQAATTLEGALPQLHASSALWPVLLSLAAVRSGQGDRVEALRIAHLADTHCRSAGDETGARRIRALIRRLER